MRLKGYPWTEFGLVAAQVTEVAAEDRDGHARVEFEVLPLAIFESKRNKGFAES